ncbi:MAG TPA: hypothetical protein O0X66_03515 [Methanocorpusculum sp.]|nr:hypothetical protein [Methanocorpusculum sp.]HJJ53552.1 hypothetical protein [Methanocorpusculum sp.]
MTEHMAADLSPAALEILLLEWWPLPTDEYAAAYRYQDLLHCMKEIQSMFEMRHKELIRMIQQEDLVSEEFVIEIPMDTVVNADLLRDELPDVYDELVFIKPSDAKRFLGLKTLYDLSVEKAGRGRVGEVERVNLLDLRKMLPLREAERYMKEVPHESLTRVARREEE